MTIDEVVNQIRDWEIEAGESWMDYFGDDCIYLNVAFLLGYWSVRYPDLYKYLMKESGGKVPWKYPQDGLVELVENYYMPNEYNEADYRTSLEPWAAIIVENEYYQQRYVDDFINRDED